MSCMSVKLSNWNLNVKLNVVSWDMRNTVQLQFNLSHLDAATGSSSHHSTLCDPQFEAICYRTTLSPHKY